MKWMKLKDFVSTYGIPMSVMQKAVHGRFAKEIARKADPDKAYNSPWLICVDKALELFKEGLI